jgi:hypothetical protein
MTCVTSNMHKSLIKEDTGTNLVSQYIEGGGCERKIRGEEEEKNRRKR